MTREEFLRPLGYLEGALGGPPKEPLISWLWTYYQSEEAGLWYRTCEIVAHGLKPSINLVAQDFLKAVSEARIERHDRMKRNEASKFERSNEIKQFDLVALAEGMAQRTGNPFFTRIAHDLKLQREKRQTESP